MINFAKLMVCSYNGGRKDHIFIFRLFMCPMSYLETLLIIKAKVYNGKVLPLRLESQVHMTVVAL